jgi:glycosyltransferase involved in cell wall biosynthesis
LPITRFGIEQSDAVTAISSYLRDATYETFCANCDIKVVYNFIDADYYRRTPNEALKRAIAPGGEKIILHISTFRPIKRIMDCIEVLARIRALEIQADPSAMDASLVPRGVAGSQFGVKMVMCGDGPERADAEILAARLGVSDSVQFVGKQPQSEIRDYLSVADLFLLPSQSESFGLSALEAMACEVPVIATRVGGVPEVIEEDGCGYMFEVGDVNGMAEAALRVLSDDSERERLGKRGREIAVSRFATETIIPQYEALYQAVINDRSR